MTARIEQLTRLQAKQLITEMKGELSPTDKATLRITCGDSEEIWGAWYDDKILAVWGLIPPSLMSERAYLWMQHSESVSDHQFVFIRHSQLVVERMLKEYPIITGHTKAGDRNAIRWLRWLGAKFTCVEGTYVEFTIRKDKWTRSRLQQWR